MFYEVEDTIAAKATPASGAPRGIVRVSGPDTVKCLLKCFRPDRSLKLEHVRDAQVIPGLLQLPPPIGDLHCELYLWPGPRSYTRQPSAELHMLGSLPLLDMALGTVCDHGARLAQPGEFTMRAFLAGRLDLTQAEAVLGVIDAESQRELDVALRQLAGGLSGPLCSLRDQLLDSLAHVEAGLDFVEEDIDFIAADVLAGQLTAAMDTVQHLLEQLQTRGTTTREYRIVLRGWPNVGKSSLLNALVGQQVAIVSPQHGTTRDYVTRPITLDGLTCLLVDTAGYESVDDDGIAQAAQQVARQQAGEAHIELLCLDATRELNDWEHVQLSSPPQAARIVVMTKCDVGVPSPCELPATITAMRTSSRTEDGITQLARAISERLRDGGTTTHSIAATAVRCRQSLLAAFECLKRAHRIALAAGGEELVAAEMHVALDELGKVVGAVYTDDILDRIFSQFCIGK